MNNNTAPHIQPIKEINYEFTQSKYAVAPKVPFRSTITGPSGSGKSVLLTNMIMDIYKGVFSRVYIWSPSINVDSIWLPVKKYIKEEMKVDTDKEQVLFEDFHSEDLMKVIETQHRITEYSKNHKFKKLYSILIVLDDIADDPRIARYSKILNSLYVRMALV